MRRKGNYHHSVPVLEMVVIADSLSKCAVEANALTRPRFMCRLAMTLGFVCLLIFFVLL